MNKQRAYKRIPYTGRVSCVVMGESPRPPREVTKSEILDISDGGMKIRTMELNIGDIILVRIPVTDSPVHVPVMTEVQWTRQNTTGTYDAGLRYLI